MKRPNTPGFGWADLKVTDMLLWGVALAVCALTLEIFGVGDALTQVFQVSR